MLNRAIQPPIREIKSYDLPIPKKYTLDNGIPIYEVTMGTQNILKLELMFFAGRWYEEKKLTSKIATSVLREGTAKLRGAEIAERIDFLGGSISFGSNLDTSHITIYTLTKHLKNILPILEEILSAPAFPMDEIQSFILRSKEGLKVDLEKNDSVAYRQLTEMIYGADHPYGYNSTAELYNEIDRNDIIQHYQNNFVSENCLMMLAGKPDAESISLINKYLGQVIRKGKSERKKFALTPYPEQKWHLSKKDNVQRAVRIGKRLFDRHHADYQSFFILNTILGGYFGSRLMQNLREDKGYTYNIYSELDGMLLDGYFFVGGDFKSDITNQAIKEIYSEFGRLREELIPAEELDMVKNYLLGSLLTAVDGPFNAATVIKTTLANNLPSNYYSQLITTIRQITANDLQKLAQRYLQDDSFYEVIVG